MKIDIIELSYQTNPVATLRQLRTLPHLVCLDSGRASGPPRADSHSRYDIISACPSEIVNGRTADAAKQLSHRLETFASPSDNDKQLPFTGGWIGYIGYEYRHAHFGLPLRPSQAEPPLWLGWYDWSVIHDHHNTRSFLMVTSACSETLIEHVRDLLAISTTEKPVQPQPFTCKPFEANMSESDYLAQVQTVREYIYAGDCYQANFAHRFSAEFDGDLLQAYQQLREAVPSPYGAYLSLDNQTILSISPERFIRIDGLCASTAPIKGTTKRGKTPEEDKALKEALQASEKNRAENVMIVDLLRNDFSQNCEAHSVTVPKLFEIHSFANVHHLISEVVGTLKPAVSHVDFILDCFPGGSITGAPKKRAMEIINELEPVERGPYCGAIGFFSSNAITEFNIAIRTFQQTGDHLHCWGGGGIVADSDPKAEYQETHQKIGSLMRALESENI